MDSRSSSPSQQQKLGEKSSSSEEDDKSGGSGDVGQVEYEMPLLAPSKDKRLLPVDRETPEMGEEEEEQVAAAVAEEEHKPYLHIALKKG